MTQSPVILWFRQDLRLANNSALQAALETGQPIIPLFILEEPKHRPLGGASRWWLHHSLTALSKSLGFLCLRRGDPHTILFDIIEKTQASQIFWNRRYTPAERQTDTILKDNLQKRGISVSSHEGFLLQEPWKNLNKSGKPFQVFTPFWKSFLQNFVPPPLSSSPTSIPTLSIPTDTLDQWDLLPTHPNWAKEFEGHWTPGEVGAQEQWKSFCENTLSQYENDRDFPGILGTSRLSPALHWGEISPWQIWHDLHDRYWDMGTLTPSAQTYLSEVGWREFAQHLLYHFPTMDHISLRSTFHNFPWRHAPADLKAWQKGQTGYPIVDAGMRELWRTGTMHNRVRMITASFLVKDLLIPWQEGEAWFWDTLLDADAGANAMNWQWVSGCGVDAAPYYRIFNPVLQGEKFDAEGHYIRRWIPELSSLPHDYIQAPWTCPPSLLKEKGIQLGKTYPFPIVDHKMARDRALALYKGTHP